MKTKCCLWNDTYAALFVTRNLTSNLTFKCFSFRQSVCLQWTKYSCNFSGNWYCKIFFVFVWFLLYSWRRWLALSQRQKRVRTTLFSHFSRQFFYPISSVKLLAANDAIVFLSANFLWRWDKIPPFYNAFHHP